jgi:high-affinity iron transporter
MLPTLVIGLREGLEASLIVGIIAAFLRREGNMQAMRVLWLGVVAAVLLCAAVGIGLRLAEENLPQKQQEGLETVVGLFAVGMVTYMLLWMQKNARSIKKELEGELTKALASGSTTALIFMAFIAVLREGFETAVFLLAAFQQSDDAQATGTGAVLGVAIAVVIGYGIYKGGVKLNLARFFSFTAFVLVLVAAGLVATAIHTSHEAGWFNGLQDQALDLTWLVKPGTVISALLTGMFGLQPRPTVGETMGWLLYFIPVTLLLLAPTIAAKLSPRPAVKAGSH